MMRRRFVIGTIIVGLFCTLQASAPLTLRECRDRARNNYPLAKNRGLIEASEGYTVSNANRGYLPQVTLSARATLQSEVTELPMKIPGVDALDRDQYQLVAELYQPVWDGGAARSQKAIARASSEAEKRKVEVDLYALNERVNQLFFGILLLAAQVEQVDLLLRELQNNLDRVTAGFKNGVAGGSDVDAMQVEFLNAMQRRTEYAAARTAYERMLAALLGLPPADSIELVKPDAPQQPESPAPDKRPEIEWFSAQEAALSSQKAAVDAATFPRIGFFVQGGYGQPGLNMLDNGFSPYWIGGLRLAWNLTGFTTRKNNLLKIERSRDAVALQREAFLLNLQLQTAQQNGEVAKYRDLIARDDDIITLRSGIKNSAQVKADNGAITVSDLIREINAESLARQVKAVHEIQYLMSIFNLKNSLND